LATIHVWTKVVAYFLGHPLE